jgi:hypothetical protein
MRGARAVLVAVLAMAVVCVSVRAETASVLLQEGVYAEEVVGDLDHAMEVYRKVIADAEANRPYVAEAHYRLGKCYLTKGDEPKAKEQFQQVVDRYPDQEHLVAAARGELDKLATARQPQGTATFGPVIELVVNDESVVWGSCLDLDTGAILSPPQALIGTHFDDEQVLAWVRENGVDLVGETNRPGIRGFMAYGMMVLGVSDRAWEDPAELPGPLAASGPANLTTVRGEGQLPVTYMFRTREGATGVLQIVGFTEDPPGARIRYKLRSGTQPAAAAQSQVFGPVIERVVNDDTVLQDCAIDLDTGELFSIPYLFTDEEEWSSWTRERGIDAGCEMGWPGLGFADAAFVRVNNDDWNASPEEVMQRVAGSSPPPFGRESALVVDGELPATCFFRTREGGTGILQIVGFTEEPKGVRIRYKLLREAVPGPAEGDLGQPSADGLSPVRLVGLGNIQTGVEVILSAASASQGKLEAPRPDDLDTPLVLWLDIPDGDRRSLIDYWLADAATGKRIRGGGITHHDSYSARDGSTVYRAAVQMAAPPDDIEQVQFRCKVATGAWDAVGPPIRVIQFLKYLESPGIESPFLLSPDGVVATGLSQAGNRVRLVLSVTTDVWSNWAFRVRARKQRGDWIEPTAWNPGTEQLPTLSFTFERVALSDVESLAVERRPWREVHLALPRFRLRPPTSAEAPLRKPERDAILRAVHDVGLAIAMYRADHKGQYPPDLDVLVKSGYYVEKGASPLDRWPDLEWRYAPPKTNRSAALVLYYWPPVDREVAVLYQDNAAQWVPVGADGVLKNPRTDEVITALSEQRSAEPEGARRRAEQEAGRQAIVYAVHNVGLAIAMYQTDHRDQYPPDLDALTRGGYLEDEHSPLARWPERRWRYVVPKTRQPGAVILYYWPPVDGEVALLFQDNAAMWAPVGSDGVLKNPRTGEVIDTSATEP